LPLVGKENGATSTNTFQLSRRDFQKVFVVLGQLGGAEAAGFQSGAILTEATSPYERTED
jgi:hypothetical protein